MRTELTHDQLTSGTAPQALIDNQAFMPAADQEPAKHRLAVRLMLPESPIGTDRAMLSATRYAGLRADLFPGVPLNLMSDGDLLVPLQRDLIRAPSGDSYWDISLSPGRVWSEPGDHGLSRAVFPFQLSNVLENDTHHGVATFLYDNATTTALRYQIAIETRHFVVPDLFDAWGILTVQRKSLTETDAAGSITAARAEIADQLPLRPWSELPGNLPAELVDSIQSGVGADSAVVNGLVIDNVIYATACRTRAGDFPFPRGMKFGIWSATKTAFGTIALLRLAQSIGEDCRAARIADLIPEAADLERWESVTIGDCLNMASGIGTAAPQAEPRNVFADYLLDERDASVSALARASFDHYFAWFLALSRAEKNREALACKAYSWGPGEVVRYRDQDLYLAGAAMDAWIKQERGPQARLWDLVRDQVYIPAGIRHAINFHTVDPDPAHSIPLTDAGLLLTMDDVARVGRLLQVNGGGRVGSEQVLHPGILAEIFDPRVEKGLLTGTHTADGEVRYHAATWHLPYRAGSGERFWLPTMRGYGGQTIQLLPNGMTAFRFAHDGYDTEERYDALTLARVADAIRGF